MCTAISLHVNHHLFGRTLDLDRSYGEDVVILPRNMPLCFRHEKEVKQHFAMIGTAHVAQRSPLFYDAVNEHGLAVAALNFPKYCHYIHAPRAGYNKILPFEVIPWILHQCDRLSHARALMKQTCILQEDFSQDLPSTPLHWIVSDHMGSFVVECTKDGMQIFDTPIDVLTNSPDYAWHLEHLANYRNLNNHAPTNGVLEQFVPSSLGTGAWGLPGDYSSPSRFVKAAFLTQCSGQTSCIENDVLQFFRIMAAISPVKGSVKTKDGADHYTFYTSCCDTETGIYYYNTYENSRICAVDMHRENLDGDTLITYPMLKKTDFLIQNETTSN